MNESTRIHRIERIIANALRDVADELDRAEAEHADCDTGGCPLCTEEVTVETVVDDGEKCDDGNADETLVADADKARPDELLKEPSRGRLAQARERARAASRQR